MFDLRKFDKGSSLLFGIDGEYRVRWQQINDMRCFCLSSHAGSQHLLLWGECGDGHQRSFEPRYCRRMFATWKCPSDGYKKHIRYIIIYTYVYIYIFMYTYNTVYIAMNLYNEYVEFWWFKKSSLQPMAFWFSLPWWTPGKTPRCLGMWELPPEVCLPLTTSCRHFGKIETILEESCLLVCEMFGPLLEYTDLYVIWIYVPCFPRMEWLEMR